LKTLVYIFGLIFILTVTNSCRDFIFGKGKQVYPSIEFDKVKKVKIYDYRSNAYVVTLNNTNEIVFLIKFFEDSSNYFKNELLEFNGTKSIYSLEFIYEKDTLDINIYKTPEKGKIELAFLSNRDSLNPSKFRKYNRFYLSDELIGFIEDYFSK